ncbi:unnamed protein product [Rotaria sordida]|uniref:HTH psq-type domain-containing protein n=2 Tax=Rotaria sordida TaxID=392033 RepID=A0A818TVD5_9BILA|nr:unnamed protein product [Rotaria sordida]CAF1597444.1 unnamed protein product [Rotaria sordida]CAF3687472.1 unnamed protein product [Rotaria sordida]
MYEVEEIEEHFAPISGVDTGSISEKSDFDDDSCIEIISNIDENENESVKLANYLQLNSDSDEDIDQDYSSTPSATLVDYLSSEVSSDNGNISQSFDQLATSNKQCNIDPMFTSLSTIVKKRKRRQWTVAEKLHAVTCFEQNNNKHKTAQQIGCATEQLHMWIKNKNELVALPSRKKGNKRKHLDRGGKKLTYVGLDSRLFTWYREKRTDPASTTNASDAGEERRRDILNSCQA